MKKYNCTDRPGEILLEFFGLTTTIIERSSMHEWLDIKSLVP